MYDIGSEIRRSQVRRVSRFESELVRGVREYRLWAPEWGLGNQCKTLSRRNPPISVTSAKGRLRSIRPSWLSNVAWSQ